MNVNPHVKFIREEMTRQGMTIEQMEKRSGVPRRTLFHWSSDKYRFTPNLANIEACLNVLGYTLTVKKIAK